MLLKHVIFLEQETQLIKACINGDRNSQSRLYKLFVPKMYAICLRYSKNPQDAEEIVQEGFVQVFKSLNNYRYIGSFEGWIRKIMIYCSIQHYRNNSKMHPVVNIEITNAEEEGNEDILNRLGKKELLKMVQALSPAYRLVFNLYVFEGMKHREIAEMLGISEGTSKSNFSDAKIILQRAVMQSLKVAKKRI
ncbi:MAG: RNA polymerase sigma factor [Segetibacter sp.]